MIASYIPAQLRAFAWLPADGSWRDDLPVPQRAAVGRIHDPSMFEARVIPGAPAEKLMAYRLTPAGVAERARLVEAGMIE